MWVGATCYMHGEHVGITSAYDVMGRSMEQCIKVLGGRLSGPGWSR